MVNSSMEYSLKQMMNGEFIEGEILSKTNFNSNFIDQLAECIVQIHKEEFKPSSGLLMQTIVEGLDIVDSFTEIAVKEFWDIKDNLKYDTCLHGDIWAGNVIIDSKGNLAGLIDWDNKQVGDPHWDLRAIRRWIGWEGLDRLINKYNNLTNIELKQDYIVILDKISICHSRQRTRFRKSVFTEYIKRYPNAI
jgi:thiamine kinase-like enzyme